MDIMQKYDERKIVREKSLDEVLPFGKRLWQAWLIISFKIGVFNSRLILTIFYFLILAPYSLAMKPFTDFMRVKGKETWIVRKTNDLTLDDVRRQS